MDADVEEIATNLGECLVQQILEGKPLDDIKASLDMGAPVWYQTSAEGISALHAAAFVQNDSLVRLLIERGAVWNAGMLYVIKRHLWFDFS
jgi:protein arginine N-methyltransferase 2